MIKIKMLVYNFYWVYRYLQLWVGAWTWSSDYESKTYEVKVVHIIVMIFGSNHGYLPLDDHFKSIQGDTDVYLKCV